LVEFADFYRTFFFLKWEMNVLLMTMYSVGLIILGYYWLRFAQEFIGASAKRRVPVVLIAGGVSLAAWVAVYLFFMDKEYNLYSAAGKLLGILPDTVFYVALAAYGLHDMVAAGKNKDRNKQDRNYFIIVNTMILLSLCWGYLDDIVLVFYPFGEMFAELYPFNLNTLIYLLFNLWTALYLYKNNYFIASSDHDKAISDAGTYTIDEIANRFNLTKREKELIELVYRGYSNPEISARLNITTGTVKRHIQNIFKKMDIKNRYELIYIIKSE
jgi:DNA-binding CsgD family transcriptional regulator